MRLFTKVSFVFFPPEGVEGKPYRTRLKGFHDDVPEWVKKDIMFRRGIEAGEIEVLDSREKQLKVEAREAGVAKDEPKEEPKATATKSTKTAK